MKLVHYVFLGWLHYNGIAGARLNVKMSSYQYRNSHYKR